MADMTASAPRVIALDGGHNFREVGGYPTKNGASLRRGLVWRSAGLNRLSDIDCQVITALGIRTIADLRTHHERELMPTSPRLTESVRMLEWSMDMETMGRPASAHSKNFDLDAFRLEIARLYTFIAEAHVEPYGQLYQSMADGEIPILIHCTAGKDRTGLAIAILLELLGVRREWVLWDYEQTNVHLDQTKVELEGAMGVGRTADWLASLGPEARALLLAADAAYLRSALDSLESRYGSVEEFALTRLGLEPPALVKLRRALLEPTDA